MDVAFGVEEDGGEFVGLFFPGEGFGYGAFEVGDGVEVVTWVVGVIVGAVEWGEADGFLVEARSYLDADDGGEEVGDGVAEINDDDEAPVGETAEIVEALCGVAGALGQGLVGFEDEGNGVGGIDVDFFSIDGFCMYGLGGDEGYGTFLGVCGVGREEVEEREEKSDWRQGKGHGFKFFLGAFPLSIRFQGC
jgi:hypothetical protein